jgi:predicted short-subunit dehydrogenase-like oxidoreductase (DUF2520 family)
MARPSLGFVGVGKVSSALTRLLYARGYVIRSIHSRNRHQAEVLSQVVGATYAASASEVVRESDITFLTVPDDVIADVAGTIAIGRLDGKAVVHTSGVHESNVMEALEQQGAMIGSWHPIFPFADVDHSVQSLPGAAFGVQTNSSTLRDWLREITVMLDGQMLTIGDNQKALYHSALVFASNYGVTLYAIAERLLNQSGANPEAIPVALNGLLAGVLRNVRRVGIPDALTGPLVRGDVGTVEAHLAALEGFDPTLAHLYSRLAYHTLPLVKARSIDTQAIEASLTRKMDDADDYT